MKCRKTKCILCNPLKNCYDAELIFFQAVNIDLKQKTQFSFLCFNRIYIYIYIYFLTGSPETFHASPVVVKSPPFNFMIFGLERDDMEGMFSAPDQHSFFERVRKAHRKLPHKPASLSFATLLKNTISY